MVPYHLKFVAMSYIFIKCKQKERFNYLEKLRRQTAININANSVTGN